MTPKSKNRKQLLDTIMDTISNQYIYDTIDYKNKDEDYIKQFMYTPLLNKIAECFVKYPKEKQIEMAKKSLVWESNKQNTLHNMILFGTQHRPDMEVNINDITIAIEIKKGDTGTDVRSGLGQCLVYQTKYSFTLFLFIDTSSDKRILNSIKSDKEMGLINSLWDNYNVMFNIV